MINLLTPERQQEILTEYRQRRRVVASWLALGGFALSLILLGVLFLHLQAARREVQMTLNRVAVNAKSQNELALKEVSRALMIAQAATRAPLLGWWETVLDAKPAGLVITDWRLARGENNTSTQISLGGRASERQVLLTFIEKLKQAEIFSVVESPISNLIKNRDLDFNLELTLQSTP